MSESYVEYAPGLTTRKSWSLYQRALKVMPGGASSQGQCYPVFDPYPLTFRTASQQTKLQSGDAFVGS